MRESKFRGISINNGEFVYGDLLHINEDLYITNFKQTNEQQAVLINEEIDPETLGEFTGHKDKNKKEIYEGDILYWKDINIKVVCVFGFNEIGKSDWGIPIKSQGFALEHIDKSGYSSFTCIKNYEVIGNIYENPELLKGE